MKTLADLAARTTDLPTRPLRVTGRGPGMFDLLLDLAAACVAALTHLHAKETRP